MAALPCSSACRGWRRGCSTTPSQCSTKARSRACASRSTCPTTASSTRSAFSPPDPCRALSCCAACVWAFQSARTSGATRWWNASPRPAVRSFSCPTARPIGGARPTSDSASPWRASRRAACRWSISTRWAARTSSSSTAPPSSCRATARWPARCRLSASPWRSPNGSATPPAGAVLPPPRTWWRRASPPTTRRVCWACATTSTRTASRASCSAFPAASIPPWWPPWRWTRSARSACIASCCRIVSPPTKACRTPPTAPSASACATTSCPSPRRWRAWSAC